jgi:hypothetical protein
VAVAGGGGARGVAAPARQDQRVKTLEGYNPGSSTYTNYILGQHVGDVLHAGGGGRGSSAGVAAGVGGAPAATPGAQSSDLGTALEAGTGTLAGLLQGARPQQPQIVATPPPMPAFAAHATLPADYVAPYSGGGPQPVQQDQQLPAFSDLSLSGSQPQGEAPAGSTAAAPGASGVAQVGSSLVEEALARARTIDAKHLPYLWGGGHGGKVNPANTGPLDCSGAVSAVLGIDPRVSGQFKSFGSPGRAPGGKGISIYANDEHVLMEIDGKFFGTSRSNPGGGAGFIPRSQLSKAYLARFTVRHIARLTCCSRARR